MVSNQRPSLRRLLLDGALTTALCYISLVLAYAIYRASFDELEGSLPRATKDAIKSIFLASVLSFGGLFALLHLATVGFPRIPRGATLAGLLLAYALATWLVAGGRGEAAVAVLVISWALLAGLLLAYGRSRTIAGFLRRRWKHLLLSAFSLVLSLELGLRLYYLASYSGTLADLYERPRLPNPGVEARLGDMIRPSLNHDVIYELKPGLDVRFLGATVRTSTRGWREDEIPLVKSPGTKRILGVGDSIMFGWGVEEAERYMDRLEASLSAEFPEVRWETVVTAVPGYNLMNEVELLESSGLAYAPDLIIYGFCGNDERLPNFVQSRKRALSLDSFTLFYLDLVRHRGGSVFATRIDDRLATDIANPRDAPEEYRHLMGRDSFLAALRRLDAIGRRTGTPVVDFDYARGATHGRQVPEGILYFNARGAVEACGGEFALSRTDPHPSARGHQALADALFSFLVESGIVERMLEGD